LSRRVGAPGKYGPQDERDATPQQPQTLKQRRSYSQLADAGREAAWVELKAWSMAGVMRKGAKGEMGFEVLRKWSENSQ
jgi:hypothetical protein